MPAVETTTPPRLACMPQAFLQWQIEQRRALFEGLLRGEYPRMLAAHLPVVSTCNDNGAAFPIHSATKGVGLLPRPRFLAEQVTRIEQCLDRTSSEPPARTLARRIEAARSLYERPERIDDGRFGSIEIFQGRTYRNLLRDARATLLFTGPGPCYLSFQLNCTAEIVAPDDLVFRFIRGMRLLFEMERFHIRQPAYSLGYVFEVREVFDKTPRKLSAAGGCPARAEAKRTST